MFKAWHNVLWLSKKIKTLLITHWSDCIVMLVSYWLLNVDWSVKRRRGGAAARRRGGSIKSFGDELITKFFWWWAHHQIFLVMSELITKKNLVMSSSPKKFGDELITKKISWWAHHQKNLVMSSSPKKNLVMSYRDVPNLRCVVNGNVLSF